MKYLKRYCQRPLPLYAHRPGHTPHPKKEGGHSFGVSEPKSYPITQLNWRAHEDYLFGIDLYNAGYFWEAHVWWEAIWIATPHGLERDFIQGLIKLAAANLKLIALELEVARTHANRGHELMSGLFAQNETSVFGVSRFWWNNIQKDIPTELELIE